LNLPPNRLRRIFRQKDVNLRYGELELGNSPALCASEPCPPVNVWLVNCFGFVFYDATTAGTVFEHLSLLVALLHRIHSLILAITLPFERTLPHWCSTSLLHSVQNIFSILVNTTFSIAYSFFPCDIKWSVNAFDNFSTQSFKSCK
jgi:hypothetical protein